ncbi:bile acid:sodium symporter [Myxococcota bacterium]|nr:bile acid:sodium symporter [Myxococcota bacterium]
MKNIQVLTAVAMGLTFSFVQPLRAEEPTTEAPTEAVAEEAEKTEAPAQPAAEAPTEVVAEEVAENTEDPSEAPLEKEKLYKHLSKLAREDSAKSALFTELTTQAHAIDWEKAENAEFVGNIRQLQLKSDGDKNFHLVRALDGTIHILWMPEDAALLEKGAKSPYANMEGMLGTKMNFKMKSAIARAEGSEYSFVQFVEAPKQLTLDRLFFVAIIILLFLTMVGMGLTLTLKDFGLVFKKPTAMIIGIIAQFGLMPLLAFFIGRMAGFYDSYPFIFLGMILIASTPGGVTSNLMTYLGKGDVALSVALTAVATVLSLFMTPLLLTLYVSNIPDFTIPVGVVFKQILVLVIVPLFVGMLIRGKWEAFAKKAEKPFALIGIAALLFLIIVGVWSNLDKFADTDRYGPAFYAIIFVLTLTGMIAAGGLAKLLRISNFQVRALSLECGLRNSSLAMTIAILLQDRIGDFHSSMFFTAGIFGLWMYAAGTISIKLFKIVLPVEAIAAEASTEKAAA